jgi:hypothetical protein
MKKVIRLTESDLVKIVKRVINENYGTITYTDGSKYNGEYYLDSDGKTKIYNGYGTYTWPDGTEYVGDFKDGILNGYGTKTSTAGNKYVGDFKDGFPNGYGNYTYADGRKYLGNFKDSYFKGYGTMTWPDGTKYVGNFENDSFNGYGVYTKKDGAFLKGMWKDGGLVTPDGPETEDVESEVSSTECNTLKAEADTQEKYNPTNLSSGKLSIGLKNQGPLVKYVQCLLNSKNKELSLGLSDLTVDGIFGNNTKKMVRKFQEKTGGLGNDGIVGKNTFLKLV